MSKADIVLQTNSLGKQEYLVQGEWTVHALADRWSELSARTKGIRKTLNPEACWDLTQVKAIDSVGIHWLWDFWGRKLPQANMSESLRERFVWLDKHPPVITSTENIRWKPVQLPIINFGQRVLRSKDWCMGLIAIVGQTMIDLFYIMRHPKVFPWKEVTAQIYHTGSRALPITAMVGFLIGIVLSYLAAYQLQIYGADSLVVNLLSMATLRELGPLLAAILVAGRSGSAMTAQIGVMRLNQELDAMSVIGIARGRRLILPRLLGLTIALPLLVLWTNIIALCGGAVGAWVQMDMPPLFFLEQLPHVTKIAHYWIGISKGAVYGFLIAIIACRYGLMVQPNTQSLGECTTASVVSSITAIILANALFAIIFKGV